jgi:serine/threonine protein kinase/Tol biopolymer transport system component
VALETGTKLGPYELGSTLGAGGMGEVYRARDDRLGREVAVKMLPASYSSDPQRLYRFEQEARAAAALNHPNILSVYDIGRQDGTPYIVSELLEGETLRVRLRSGALSIRKALDYAVQIAHGLAAAHDKGIVHRDLKPENLFITKDGRVKILDFGLAKLTFPEGAIDEATRTLQTDAGGVVGTVGYMSPEQVRGKATDARTDLFSFGAVLYEMLAGQRAFQGDTAADTMTAILTREPPELTRTNQQVPTALEHIVRHCLEKNPEERFHSARDLAFDLSMLSSVSSGTLPQQGAPTRKRPWWPAALAAAVGVIALAAFFGGRFTAPSAEPPVFHQLTFRRGWIDAASFAPDGHTIIYGAGWDGDPVQLFSTRDDSPGSIPLSLKNVNLLSVSSAGDMAVLLNRHNLAGWVNIGTLARLPLNSAAPRPVLEDVTDIAWSPLGTDFAVVRYVDHRFRLEYPAGKVLYDTTTGWISYPRFSPRGDRIAFMDHPVLGDDRGYVSMVDLAGHKTSLTPLFASEAGLQWSPGGNEVWFTASDSGISTALFAVTTAGRKRAVARAPGRMILQDIARDGRVLLRDGTLRRGSFALGPGQPGEKDIAVLDWNLVRGISADGQYVLSTEEGEGGGANYSIYLRKTDGSPPTRLGEGDAWSLSPDGKWVASTDLSEHPQIVLLPTGAGEPRQITHDQSDHAQVHFFPDGHRISFTAVEPHGARRVYVQDLSGGPARAITPPGIGGSPVSPDGHWVLATDFRGKFWLYPPDGGEPRAIAGLNVDDNYGGWSADDGSLFVWRSGEVPKSIYRVNINTGARTVLKRMSPADPAGVLGGAPVLVTPDGRYYVYGFTRDLADLYVVTGLK